MMFASYGIDCDLTITCRNSKFEVHRNVIAQASPIWLNLLKERPESIDLRDDPSTLKAALDILYSSVLTCINVDAINVHSPELHALIDKYELFSARNIVQQILKEERMQAKVSGLETRLNELQDEHERDKRRRGMLPGMEVLTADKPPIGTRVIESNQWAHLYSDSSAPATRKRGHISSYEGHESSEIVVKWDDGTERSNSPVGKKHGYILRYE